VDIGEIVQVIPLRKQLSIIKLEVMDTKKRDDFDDGTDIWYEVELEKISENYKEYWTIKSLSGIREEYPSEVLIVYPPVKNCTLLQGVQFESKDLPENISHDIIKGALDFDGDELPDAIVCAFCCSNRQAIVTCDNICGETYIKVNNKWTLIRSSSPL
jgi:hypothetical protein